ncbi:MAG: methylmalonyl-CoA mutase family protein [Bacteroidota bacterium]
MSESTNNKFFEEFPEIDKKNWKEQIIKDLKGADYNEKLILKSSEGFEIEPFYNDEDLNDLESFDKYQGWKAEATVNSLSPRQWENRALIQVVDPVEANKKAIFALQNGADGVSFKFSGPIDANGLSFLLQDILLEYCAVSFIPAQPILEFAKLFIEFTKNNQYSSDKLTGSIAANASEFDEDQLVEYMSLFSDFGSYQIFAISGNAEEAYSKRLGKILAETIKLIDIMLAKDINVVEVVKKVEFDLNATNDYFKQIAALRALRILLDLVVKQYGVSNFDASQINILATTTVVVDDQTKEDPYMNMLSNTNQAMACIIGGCNALTILPHNLGIEEVKPFAERIARNVSSVLKEESYFDKVADPASGSYYIESLTNKMAEKSWEQCQSLID